MAERLVPASQTGQAAQYQETTARQAQVPASAFVVELTAAPPTPPAGQFLMAQACF